MGFRLLGRYRAEKGMACGEWCEPEWVPWVGKAADTAAPSFPQSHSIHTGVRTAGTLLRVLVVAGGEGRAGSQAATLTICVSQALSPETIQKATPSCHPSCFLLPSGPLLLQSHWSRSKSCHHQKEPPSPERSLSTSHSDQETKRLQQRESQPLPCRRCTLLSSLVKSFT